MRAALYCGTAAALSVLAIVLSLGERAEHESSARPAATASTVKGDVVAFPHSPTVVVGACQIWGTSPWSTTATTCDVNRDEANSPGASTDVFEVISPQVGGRNVVEVAQALATNTHESNANFMLILQDCLDPGPPGHEEGCLILRSHASTFISNLEALARQGDSNAQGMLTLHLDQERAFAAKPKRLL